MVQAHASLARSGILDRLRSAGFARVEPATAANALALDLAALAELRDTWERLPRDPYLRDGGHYRARRHSCFLQTFVPASSAATLRAVARRAHWQPTSYNALHGGLERWFEPLDPAVTAAGAWQQLVGGLGELFAELRPVERWHIEAHQFRIDTAAGIGRPTPEGAHRDGVDFVAVVLVGRRAVRGGETRVFDAHGPTGVRFTMEEPWSMLLMDDARVIHETTPIQSAVAADIGGMPGEARASTAAAAAPAAEPGVRDTLVLTYRAQGFQEPGHG